MRDEGDTDKSGRALSAEQRFALLRLVIIAATTVAIVALCIPLAYLVQPDVSVSLTAAITVSGSLAVAATVSTIGWAVTGRVNRRLARAHREACTRNRQLAVQLAQINTDAPMLEGTDSAEEEGQS